MHGSEVLAPVERRLHPLSWLFVLLQQLREFALPLVVLLVFGRGGDWQELAAAVAAVAMALVAALRYYTYRFSIGDDELVIRSGLLQRSLRHLPFHRIHAVELRQGLLHRWAGVAEVRLDAGSAGDKAEATMRVLALRDAEALEALVRRARQGSEAAEARPDPAASDAESAARWRCSWQQLVWLGLASNRGMIVVGAGMGALWQLNPGGFGRELQGLGSSLFSRLADWHLGLGFAAAAMLLLVGVSLALRLLGVLVVLVRYAGFELQDDGQRYRSESGLFTRVRRHAPRAKIQRWLIEQPLLLRWRGLFGLRVETAATRGEDGLRDGIALLPVTSATAVGELLSQSLPGCDLAVVDWQPIHPRAWLRWAKWPSLLVAVLVGIQITVFGLAAAPLLLLLPLPWLHARGRARFSGWALQEDRLLWRSGWLQRQWQLIELDRIQALRLRQSPFDRQAGMASLDIDTAGATAARGVTCLELLPEAQARALCAALATRLCRRLADAPVELPAAA